MQPHQAMPRTLSWQLYVSGYTFLFGLPLLLMPNAIIPYFGFAPTGEAWVRLAGMFLLGLCYISTMVYRHRCYDILLHSIVMRAWFTIAFLAFALSGYEPFFFVTAAIVGFGVAGSMRAYWSESAEWRRRAGG